ncbi:MAG TPA: sigma-70 family RNA polymerase sigma factor [Phycisphaerae bacterium]|nr:sigma-70 family RNA polymerase sigma factor [Phycisphaerae bacterium]
MPPDSDLATLYQSAVRLHARELFNYAYRLCGRRDLAEDLVQETFLHAWRSLSGLRDAEKIRPWLYRILRRRYARMIRYRWFGRLAQLEVRFPIPAAKDSSIESIDQRETLQAALDKLDNRFKQPFLMVYQEGLSCQDTAAQLQVPLGTVLSRIFRARKMLRDTISENSTYRNSQSRSASTVSNLQRREVL